MDLAQTVRELTAGTAARVRIGYPWWLRGLLARSVVGIALGRRIYLRSDVARLDAEGFGRLLRHELAHVRQVERVGLVRFLALYCFEFLRNLARTRSIALAYTAISFEVEARAAEESVPISAYNSGIGPE